MASRSPPPQLKFPTDGGEVTVPFALRDGLTWSGQERFRSEPQLFSEEPVDPEWLRAQVQEGLDVRDLYLLSDRTREFDELVSNFPHRLTEDQLDEMEDGAVCVTHFEPQLEQDVQDELARKLFNWPNPVLYPQSTVLPTPEDFKAVQYYRHRRKKTDLSKVSEQQKNRHRHHRSSRPERIFRASADLAGVNKMLCGLPLFLAEMCPRCPGESFQSDVFWYDVVRLSLRPLRDLNARLEAQGYDLNKIRNLTCSLDQRAEQLQRDAEALNSSAADSLSPQELESRLGDLKRAQAILDNDYLHSVPREHTQRTILLQLPTALLMTLFSFRSGGATRNAFWNNSRSNADQTLGETNCPALEAVLSWGHSRDLNLLVRDYYEFCCESDDRKDAFWSCLSGMPVSEALRVARTANPDARRKARREWAVSACGRDEVHQRMVALAVLFDKEEKDRTSEAQVTLLLEKVLGESASQDSEEANRAFNEKNREYLELLRSFEQLSEQAEELLQRDDVVDPSAEYVSDEPRPKLPRRTRKNKKSSGDDPASRMNLEDSTVHRNDFPRNPLWKLTTVEVMDDFRETYLRVLEFERVGLRSGSSESTSASASAFLGHPTDFLFPALDPNRLHLGVSRSKSHSERLIRSMDAVGVLKGAAAFLKEQFSGPLKQTLDPQLVLSAFVGSCLRLLVLLRRKFRNWATALPFDHRPCDSLPVPPNVEANAREIPATDQSALVYFRRLPPSIFRTLANSNAPVPIHVAWSQAFWWQNLDQQEDLYRTVRRLSPEEYLDTCAGMLMLGRDEWISQAHSPFSHQKVREDPVCPFDHLFPKKTHDAYTVGKNSETIAQAVLTEKLNLQTRLGPSGFVYFHLPSYAESVLALSGTALLFRNHSSLRLRRRSPHYYERYDLSSPPPPPDLFRLPSPLPKLATLVAEKRDRTIEGLADRLASQVGLELASQRTAFLEFWTSDQSTRSESATVARRNVLSLHQVSFAPRVFDSLSRQLALPSTETFPTSSSSSSSAESHLLRQRMDRLFQQTLY